jgi:hypothetical protein
MEKNDDDEGERDMEVASTIKFQVPWTTLPPLPSSSSFPSFMLLMKKEGVGSTSSRKRRKKVSQSIRRLCRNTSCAVVFSFPLSHTHTRRRRSAAQYSMVRKGKLYLDEMLGPSEQSQGGVSGGFRS